MNDYLDSPTRSILYICATRHTVRDQANLTACSWLQAWYADFGSPSEFGKNVCQMAVEYVSERVVNITLGPEAFVNLTTSEHSGPMVR